MVESAETGSPSRGTLASLREAPTIQQASPKKTNQTWSQKTSATLCLRDEELYYIGGASSMFTDASCALNCAGPTES